jgi:zinc protease
MNDIIGGNSFGRINENLRVDKHWSYGARTLLQSARGQRPWLVYAPVQTDKTADSIAELVGEFERFLSIDPASEEERNREVRNNANSLPGQYESADAVMTALQANERFGWPDDFVATLKAQYEAVDLDKIQAAAEQVIHPGKLTWVIVGDRGEIEESLRALNIGPIAIMDADGNMVDG